MKGKIFFLIIALAICGCGENLKLNDTQAQGKMIFESLCDKCHNLIPPPNHTDIEWVTAVDKYGVKLKLQKPELDALKAYLTYANDKLK